MTLFTRRILYSIFVALFLIIAPPLILYTAGYRYDFEYRRVVETGSLVVKSVPESASIYLDGELYSVQTPTIVNTILPGKINLLVAKPGYHKWEKRIEIYPRVTTFEDHIKLYPKTQPEALIAGSITSYWWNTKQEKIAYLTEGGELRLFNTLNSKDTLIANVTKERPFADFSWSPHDDQFLFSRIEDGKTAYYIIDANTFSNVIALTDVVAEPLTSVVWNPNTKNTVYAITKAGLVRIPYLLETVRVVARGTISAYLAERDRILFIQAGGDNGEPGLFWIHPADQNTIHRVPGIAADGQDELLSTNSHQIALYNNQTHLLQIIDPTIRSNGIDSGTYAIANVQNAFFSKDGTMLVYTDGFAIYKQPFVTPITVIPQKNESQLVTRYSQPITALSWADDEFHILYQVDTTIRVAELGPSSDPRNTILAEGATTARGIVYVAKQKAATYIDEFGWLQFLPLSLDQERTFFFGG